MGAMPWQVFYPKLRNLLISHKPINHEWVVSYRVSAPPYKSIPFSANHLKPSFSKPPYQMANKKKTLQDIKKVIQITSEQHQLIVGSCLGDLYIQHRQNKHSRVGRLRFAHSPNQAQLVDWKYSRLRILCVETKPPHREEKKGSYNFYTSWLSS